MRSSSTDGMTVARAVRLSPHCAAACGGRWRMAPLSRSSLRSVMPCHIMAAKAD